MLTRHWLDRLVRCVGQAARLTESSQSLRAAEGKAAGGPSGLRRKGMHASRVHYGESLEVRQVMAATPIAGLSDEFNDAASINQWSEVNHVEGWGPRGAQLNQWTVNAGGEGRMVMQPHSVVWYEDWRGPLVFKEVTGDFVVTTKMRVTDRDNIGGSDADDVPGDSQFSLGGLMIRTPRAITNGAADWVPGSHSNDGNVGENYVFMSMGYATGTNRYSFEVKTTRNSTSNLELTPLGLTPNEVELRIARIGSTVIVLHRLDGEANWTVHRRYSRPDMPQTLQVGMVTYSDWEKANDLTPVVHNGAVIAPGQISDPSPFQPFNPDLTASFDYTRFDRPQVPAELAGVNLLTATDNQLLSFLGQGGDANPEPPKVTRIGMNASGVVDWDPGMMFRDAFQRARPWGTQAQNVATGDRTWQFLTGEGPTLAVDQHGWVASLPQWQHSNGTVYQQIATTVLFTDEARQPAGIYRAEWTGNGNLEMPFVTESGTMPDGRHYALVNMPFGVHFAMQITSTDSANPIRDIHLWMPDYNGQSLVGEWHPGDAGSPFHPLFVDRLDAFDTLRFMDLMNTNQTDVVTWNDRPKLDDASQSDGDLTQYFHTHGVAPEYLIELSNETGANPWFNMPHQANDDYVRQFATMVRDTLDPELKVYVEWSNEIWNGIFPTYHWLAAQTQLPENAGLDFFAIAGREMRRDFDIWSDVFAGQEDRLVRVVAGQQANVWLTEQFLANVAGRVDAVSATAYAGIGPEQVAGFNPVTTTPDDIIDSILNVSIPWASARLREHESLIETYEAMLGRDLQFVTYESGAHVMSAPNPFFGTELADEAFTAQSSPRMYDVYQTLLNVVNDAGVDLYNEFSFTSHSSSRPYGSFGVLHDMTTPLSEAHKLRSLYDYIAASSTENPNSAPVLSTLGNQQVREGSLLTFTATATDPDNDNLTFSLANAPTGATIDPQTGRFNWTPTAAQGPTTYQITVRVSDDGSPSRSDEQVINVTVLDMPQLSIGDVTVTERDTGSFNAQFFVTLSAASFRPVTVSYATANVTATAGSDYQSRTGTLTFAAGETRKTINIPILGDRRDEADETFVVRLSNAVDAIFADNEAVGTILDNDPLPTLSLTRATATEGDANPVTANVSVRLSAASDRSVIVNFTTVDETATAGNDYAATSGTLTFAPGETTKTIPVTIIPDLLDEANETFAVQISDATNATLPTLNVRVTINDNDPAPVMSISNASIQEGTSGTRELIFTVSLSAASGRPVTVRYSTSNGTARSGVDYQAATGTVTFAAGETSQTIRITLLSDALFEADETFFVRLTSPVNATLGTARGTGTIINDD